MTYRISTVAEMTGIARNTLIAWERRYGFVRPQRRSNGYRSYDEDDVTRILRVKNAVSAGLKISEAVQLLRASDKRLEETGTPLPRPSTEFNVTEEGLDRIRTQLVDALVGYDREAADQLLTQLITVPFSTRLQKVYFPVLSDLGQLWETGEITIAQEHYASGVIRSNLAALLISVGPPASDAVKVACTTFEGDQHEIVALALAVQMALRGRRVTYLGANMPADDLARFCVKQRPDLLCVSCIRRPSEASFKAYQKALLADAPEDTRIVIGGTCLDGLSADSPRIEILPRWEDFQD